MSQNQSPNQNPADTGSILGAAKTLLNAIKSDIDGMLPVKVVSHDRAKRTVKVEHLIDVILSDDTTMARGTQSTVQTLVLGGGGFVVDFYLPPGSLGWLLAADRDLSIFKQSFKTERPNTLRKKTFEDALFIPDVMTGYDVASEDQQAMVIQSMDGLTKISLTNDRIKMTGKKLIQNFDEVEINATSTTINSTVSINGSSLTHNGTNVGDDHKHPAGGIKDSGGGACSGNSGSPQ